MKKAVIIGAGPAGLAAAHRLSKQGIDTVVLEKDAQVGGLSRTILNKGFYFDIGGHRFYARNEEVLQWWQGLLGEDFLKIPRLSRIYYRQTFFDYPISLSNVFSNIGLVDSFLIFLSYLKSRLFPLKEESNLKQWLTNRFGSRLYRIFFRQYTEKVWGAPCKSISSDWASERIKGLSMSVALKNAFSGGKDNKVRTLIKEFYYPRLGSGMMYEKAASEISRQGGRIHLNTEAVRINRDDKRIVSVLCEDKKSRKTFEVSADFFCSSMPLTSLVERMSPAVEEYLLQGSGRLGYRALVMVYLIVDKKNLSDDNWIYINSSSVKVCRIQNFERWSMDMVADKDTSSLGMEYFCDEKDAFWSQPDSSLIGLAKEELEKLGLCRQGDVRDAFVARIPQAYPLYRLDYRKNLQPLVDFVRGFSNLQCIGRNGMFQYNNMERSVYSGFLAADNMLGKKNDLWSVNLDGP